MIKPKELHHSYVMLWRLVRFLKIHAHVYEDYLNTQACTYNNARAAWSLHASHSMVRCVRSDPSELHVIARARRLVATRLSQYLSTPPHRSFAYSVIHRMHACQSMDERSAAVHAKDFSTGSAVFGHHLESRTYPNYLGA